MIFSIPKNNPTLALVLGAILFISSLGPAHAADPAKAKAVSRQVRVLVAEAKPSMTVSVKGAYIIRSLPNLAVVKKGEALQGLAVVYSPKGMQVGKEVFLGRGLRVEPAKDRDLYLNKSRFRGTVDVWKDEQTKSLYAINTLDVEGYLYGVLHHEVAQWWPMEALRAQAIAARTYALYQAAVNRSREYDLKSDTSSQVYGGSTVERFRTKRAIDQTAGQVLTFKGKIFPAYFHATCAGQTAAASELWKIDLPPLAGGARCEYCRISPHFYWAVKVPLSEIEEKMNKNNRPLGQILKIEPITQTPSGRVGSLRVTGTTGETVMAAKDFRIWIGGDRIRSTFFSVDAREDMADFKGEGWGHGVGLCQWGALGQALLGHSHQQILQFYYPGAAISDRYASG